MLKKWILANLMKKENLAYHKALFFHLDYLIWWLGYYIVRFLDYGRNDKGAFEMTEQREEREACLGYPESRRHWM